MPVIKQIENIANQLFAIIAFVGLTCMALGAISELVARSAIQTNLESELRSNAMEVANAYRFIDESTSKLDGETINEIKKKIRDREQSNGYVLAQIKSISRLNAVGSRANPCGTLRSIASGIPGFERECYCRNVDPVLERACNIASIPPSKSVENAPAKAGATAASQALAKSVLPAESQWVADANYKRFVALYSSFSELSIFYFFEQQPSELLFLIIAVACGGFGRVLIGLRTSDFTGIRDLAIGTGAGFIVYLVISSGTNSILLDFSVSKGSDRPFAVALMGFLVGAFADFFYALLLSGVRSFVSKLTEEGRAPAAHGSARPGHVEGQVVTSEKPEGESPEKKV